MLYQPYRRKPKTVARLEVEQAVYVPSTQDVDKKITDRQFNTRVREVKRYMNRNFEGSTSVIGVGSFNDKKKGIVDEKVVMVQNFADSSTYRKKKPALMKQIKKWGRRWGQTSMGYECETDMYYIAPNKRKYPEVRRRVVRRINRQPRNNYGGFRI